MSLKIYYLDFMGSRKKGRRGGGGVKSVPLREKKYFTLFYGRQVPTVIKLEWWGVKAFMELPLKNDFFCGIPMPNCIKLINGRVFGKVDLNDSIYQN